MTRSTFSLIAFNIAVDIDSKFLVIASIVHKISPADSLPLSRSDRLLKIEGTSDFESLFYICFTSIDRVGCRGILKRFDRCLQSNGGGGC